MFLALLISLSAHATEPARGVLHEGKNAIVTIVEFADYQCPYCKRATEALAKVEAEYGDKVRIVFRNFPLSFHENARSAALAANCADSQGHFREMHDFLFAHQSTLGRDAYVGEARDLGLDVDQFSTCLDSAEASAQVDRDISDANNLGVSGTPNFFLSGYSRTERLNGAYPFEDFKAKIDSLLKP